MKPNLKIILRAELLFSQIMTFGNEKDLEYFETLAEAELALAKYKSILSHEEVTADGKIKALLTEYHIAKMLFLFDDEGEEENGYEIATYDYSKL